MRKTHALMQIAVALMADPSAWHWGYEVSRRADVRSGVMYPILRRMLEKGWLADGWEDGEPTEMGRPPRRYYRVTSEGRKQLGALLESARTESRFRHLFSEERQL